MHIVTREQRLVARAYWLVTHRWMAIIALGLTTWLTGNITDIELSQIPLYLMCLALIVENLFALWLLEFITHRKKGKLYESIRWVIHFQITLDLILLTGILHFTGGIANPFFFIYIFHMVIASILLLRIEAFLHTTFALLLFGTLVFLEYKSIIPYYCLCSDEITNYELYKDPYFIIKTYGVFAFSSYILLYLATSIGHRLRNQEDRLTEAIKQLKKNDEIKNQYVMRITHDIKSHLAAIQTSLSVLTNNVFGELKVKQQEFLNRAYNRTIELTKFSKKLLHLTRLRLGDEMDKQILSLGDMIVEAINNQYELAEEKGLTFELRLDESVDKYYGNKVSFESIFDNLISNAIKYSEESGVISVVSKDKLRRIQIEITDQGIGIPANEKEDVFKEFFRASNVKNTGIKGSGVGLSLVKESVESHNGRIFIQSQLGNGTKFIIELPKS
jgi:signal transduction histidine kinase